MQKVYAINGSPRRNKNTASMLDSFLKGVETNEGFTTERIDLFDYNIRGCTSCFGCKKRDPATYGKCVLKDDVGNILDKVLDADGIVFGSPVYFGNVTGQMLCFLERLLYPLMSYEENFKILSTSRIPTAFIYTMSATEEESTKFGYDNLWKIMENHIGTVFSEPERICAYYTYQFDNYSTYHSEVFDESDRAKYRDLKFPDELREAYEAGKRMGSKIKPHPKSGKGRTSKKNVSSDSLPSDPQDGSNLLSGSWRVFRHYAS